MDIGAEYKNYSADVTRTIPANGKFNKSQRDIYNIVLKALDETTAKSRIRHWEDQQKILSLRPGVEYSRTAVSTNFGERG